MRLISMPDLKAEKGVPYSRPHIYRLIAANGFPKPIHCGGNRIAFVESEIDAWIASKIAERDSSMEAGQQAKEPQPVWNARASQYKPVAFLEPLE